MQRLMAYVLAAQDREEEALGFARQAFDRDPGPESVAVMAWVLVSGGIDVPHGERLATDADSATDSWELPFVLPHVAPIEHILGLAALRQGRLAEAVARLEAAADAYPRRASVRAHLEEARIALRDAQG
jgi:hypothetical protein